MDNILDSTECDTLIMIASHRLERSKIYSGKFGERVDERRSSHGTFLSRNHWDLVRRLDERIAGLLNWPVDQMEDIHVLRYEAGEQYLPHYDFFDATSSEALSARGQRIATLVMYLNEPVCGGETVFPLVPLEIFPRQGRGVFFVYPDPQTHQSKRTLHGGAPVLKGSKWIATKWLRIGKFEEK